MHHKKPPVPIILAVYPSEDLLIAHHYFNNKQILPTEKCCETTLPSISLPVFYFKSSTILHIYVALYNGDSDFVASKIKNYSDLLAATV